MILSLVSEPFREGVTGEIEALERPAPELMVRRRLPGGSPAPRRSDGSCKLLAENRKPDAERIMVPILAPVFSPITGRSVRESYPRPEAVRGHLGTGVSAATRPEPRDAPT